MGWIENPVLQRELLVNLRLTRNFFLLLIYLALLGFVVYFAWPKESRLVANAEAARRLVDMLFLGQYTLVSLMTPSFAAGCLTGEKERKTYELLLAAPLRPAAIVSGKLLASLVQLGIVIFASLPIIMLCLPLGGVSIYEVLVAYLALFVSVVTFGMISIACSSYFQRTAAAVVASYLLILPLAIVAVLCWSSLASSGQSRLIVSVVGLGIVVAICVALFRRTCERLLYPPDVGSEGNEVLDPDSELDTAIGLVIQRDQFPDRLFAPPKRTDLMSDGANPVYDKEIHSEIFSQGTLMLRLVIQISLGLALPIMAFCLFFFPEQLPWYVGYVLVFNTLVGPVFFAGSLTSERERQTLDLLLTTMITPWQILTGKWIAGLRISTVLTLFLVWPMALATLMVREYWVNFGAMAVQLAIILMTCATTSVLGLFYSVLCSRTSYSLISCYLTLLLQFFFPLAAVFFVQVFFPESTANDASVSIHESIEAAGGETPAVLGGGWSESTVGHGLVDMPPEGETADGERNAASPWQEAASPWQEMVRWSSAMSPFAAAFSVPWSGSEWPEPAAGELWWQEMFQLSRKRHDRWLLARCYFIFSAVWIGGLTLLMFGLFQRRWRVAQ